MAAPPAHRRPHTHRTSAWRPPRPRPLGWKPPAAKMQARAGRGSPGGGAATGSGALARASGRPVAGGGSRRLVPAARAPAAAASGPSAARAGARGARGARGAPHGEAPHARVRAAACRPRRRAPPPRPPRRRAQNIGGENAGDAFYRYKMPRLQAKVRSGWCSAPARRWCSAPGRWCSSAAPPPPPPPPPAPARVPPAQIEGRGNGIKTNVVNNVEVAKALERAPECERTRTPLQRGGGGGGQRPGVCSCCRAARRAGGLPVARLLRELGVGCCPAHTRARPAQPSTPPPRHRPRPPPARRAQVLRLRAGRADQL